MGSSSSKEAAASTPPSGGCPVKQPPKSEGGCPVKKDNNNKTVYNVYSQPIDATNNMPSIANQLPAPQQSETLSTDRVKSTISKGNTDNNQTWTYPSPQMFYNALVRKGKLGDTKEEDISSVVALHNNMNERTWRQVVEWEKLAGEDDPKLLKFIGRPCDLSPKARLKHWLLFHPLPFDRHDWTVQRSDGTTVRYVIDYYHDETQSSGEEGTGMPALTDHVKSLLVDVRPALDRPQDLYQRAVKMPSALSNNTTAFEQLPLAPSESLESTMVESMQVWDSIIDNKLQEEQQRHAQEAANNIGEKEATALAKAFVESLKNCKKAQKRVANCNSDVECQQAALDLTRCMGQVWCPLQLAGLTESLTNDNDADIEVALERLTTCVQSASQRTMMAREQFPSVFPKKK